MTKKWLERKFTATAEFRLEKKCSLFLLLYIITVNKTSSSKKQMITPEIAAWKNPTQQLVKGKDFSELYYVIFMAV